MTPAQAKRAEQARAILAGWRTSKRAEAPETAQDGAGGEPFTADRAPFTADRAPFTADRAPFTVGRGPFTGRIVEAADEIPDGTGGEFARRIEVACAIGAAATPELTAELAARDEGPLDASAPEALAAAREDGAATPASTFMTREWGPLGLAMMCDQAPPQPWLLRWPSMDGKECAPGQGDGLLPRGRVGLLVSEGGAGKTMSLIALALCIVTGREWLGHWHVDPDARGGRVLLGLAEEDRDEVWRRVRRWARHMQLSEIEAAQCAARIVALPLAGTLPGLTTSDGWTLQRSAVYDELYERLRLDAGDGWACVVLDPLARWAGGDVEGNNAIATAFLSLIEGLCDVPGRPTVLVSHHSSKSARREKGVDARGVTGITDAARWVATLMADGEDLIMRQAKSNCSRPMRDSEVLRLARRRGGVLELLSVGEGEERERRRAEAHREQTARDVEVLVERLRQGEGWFAGADSLGAAMGWSRTRGRAACQAAVGAGRVRWEGTTRDRRLVVVCAE